MDLTTHALLYISVLMVVVRLTIDATRWYDRRPMKVPEAPSSGDPYRDNSFGAEMIRRNRDKD